MDRAHALFARCAELRGEIPQDARWFAEMYEACDRFVNSDDLPSDPLMRDAVLALHEFDCLLHHAVGNAVSERMARIHRMRGVAA